jgi:septal ring factor EnvC (AmiA/AmiB activator)
MLKQTADDLNQNRKQLYDRGQKLAGLIQEMQFNKTDSEKRIRKLEEAFADHQQLVASYRVLEDRIKEQERQQEIALAKMVDAVTLAEVGAADAQKSRMTRDGLADELRRVKPHT